MKGRSRAPPVSLEKTVPVSPASRIVSVIAPPDQDPETVA